MLYTNITNVSDDCEMLLFVYGTTLDGSKTQGQIFNVVSNV